jgi:membrane protein DedA with SNARE-associated domain
LADFATSIISFVQDHRDLAPLVVFLLAFCESFAFVSLIVPATGILLGVGALVAAARFDFVPIWPSAAPGAIAGDWLAYALACQYKRQILALWPFSRHPERVARGVRSSSGGA